MILRSVFFITSVYYHVHHRSYVAHLESWNRAGSWSFSLEARTHLETELQQIVVSAATIGGWVWPWEDWWSRDAQWAHLLASQHRHQDVFWRKILSENRVGNEQTAFLYCLQQHDSKVHLSAFVYRSESPQCLPTEAGLNLISRCSLPLRETFLTEQIDLAVITSLSKPAGELTVCLHLFWMALWCNYTLKRQSAVLISLKMWYFWEHSYDALGLRTGIKVEEKKKRISPGTLKAGAWQ